MKILITGAGGMLGTDLTIALKPLFEVVGVGRSAAPHLEKFKVPFTQLDLSNRYAAFDFIQKEKPNLILHAAAMTDVDGCEKNPDLAFQGNLEVTRNVLDAASRSESCVVFFSTDYVFDGGKNELYREECAANPISVYGESKRRAEIYMQENGKSCVIIRLSWLYGFYGKSFPRTILERARQQKEFQVVNDQTGRPTYTKDLAEAIAGLLKKDPRSFEKWNKEIFHFGNDGQANWAEFADYILKQAGYHDAVVTPIKSEKLNRPARRPEHSVMSLEKAEKKLGVRLRSWQNAFLDFLQEFRQGDWTRGAA